MTVMEASVANMKLKEPFLLVMPLTEISGLSGLVMQNFVWLSHS